MLPVLPLLLATAAHAGGSPLDVLVVWNADDPEAADTAAHYQQARQIPAAQLCAVSGVDPLADRMPFDDFDLMIRDPVEACIAALPEPDAIDYLVLVKGLPYLVDLPVYSASLEAVLQLGRAVDGAGVELAGRAQDDSNGFAAPSLLNPVYVDGSCTDLTVSNPYAGWYTGACGLAAQPELPATFKRAEDRSFGGNDFTDQLFAITRLDGFDHADARALVDRAVAADGSFPAAEILCMEGADEARAARDPECEYAARLLDADGLSATWLSPHDSALAGREVAAYLTGAAGLTGAIDGQTYAPGALVCNLTSYGAVPANFRCSPDGATCPASESQTSIARFVRAGATAVHGTAAEPLNNSFPNAGMLLLYTSGYNLAESVLYSQRFLHWQNVVLGDPLLAPYAERPVVDLPTELAAGATLEVRATHPDGVARVAVYVDGALAAEADSDVLQWAPPGSPGDGIEVLAVARARQATVQRTGWPVAEQTVRARPQGWTAATLRLTEPASPADTGASADPGDNGAGGCGCTHASPLSTPWLGTLGVLLLRRRRAR